VTLELTPFHKLLALAKHVNRLEQTAKLWLKTSQLKMKVLKAPAVQCKEAFEAVLEVIPDLRQTTRYLSYEAWSANQQQLIEVLKSYEFSPELTTAFQEALYENSQDIQHFMQPDTVSAISEILELQVKMFMPLLDKLQWSNGQDLKEAVADLLKPAKQETFLDIDLDSLAGIELTACALLFMLGFESLDSSILTTIKSEQVWLDPSL